jgi:hypothetical protein
MCSAPKPPPPQAPPAPIPVRDNKLEGVRNRASAAQKRASGGSYESTLLTGPGGVPGQAPTAQPTLGT